MDILSYDGEGALTGSAVKLRRRGGSAERNPFVAIGTEGVGVRSDGKGEVG